MFYPDHFDVIVFIGGGHASTEAAMAAGTYGPSNAFTDSQYRRSGSDVLQPCYPVGLVGDIWLKRSMHSAD